MKELIEFSEFLKIQNKQYHKQKYNQYERNT